MMNWSLSRFSILSVCSMLLLASFAIFAADADMQVRVSSQTDSSAFVDGQLVNIVSPTDTYTYDVQLSNLSPIVANNVTVTMVIPEETEFVQSTYDPMISSGNNLIWSFGDLEGNFDYDWSVTVQVKRDVEPSISDLNCVITVNTPNDSVAANNTDTDIVKYHHKIVAPQSYDLAIDLDYSADHDTVITRNGQNYYAVFINEPFQYNIRVQNNSNVLVENISIIQELPTGVQYTSSQPAAVFAGNTLTWELSELAANSFATFTVNAFGNFETEQSASSEVEVIAESDSFATNNTDSESLWFVPVSVQDQSYDLVLTLDALSDTSYALNGYDYPGFDEKIGFKYHVRIVNNGAAAATDINVQLDVPDELKVNKTTHSPIQNIQNTITWNIEELDPGYEWNEVVEVDPLAKFPYYPYQLAASAELQASDDTNAANNQANVNVFALENPTVLGEYADLSISAVAQTDSVHDNGSGLQYFAKAEETFIYRIDVENTGNLDAENIKVVTMFDSRLSGANILPNPQAVSVDSVVWQMNNIVPAGKQSFRIEFTVPGDLAVGLNELVIQSWVECSNEPVNLLDDNSVNHIIYNEMLQAPDFTPEISLSKTVADVSDSVYVSVFFPVPVNEWTLTIALPNGQLIQDFAQSYIATQQISPNTWMQVDVPYVPQELYSGSPEDNVAFQLQALGQGGSSGYAEATLTVNSTNELLLERNVFKPLEEALLDINFKMIADAHALCEIYDTAGHKILTLADDFYTGGWTTLQWDGKDDSGLDTGSGVYLVTLTTDHSNLYKKVIIVR